MEKILRITDLREVLYSLHQEEISFSRMVEILNEKIDERIKARNKIMADLASQARPWSPDGLDMNLDKYALQNNISNRFEIFSSICNERECQDAKWGIQNHQPADWCMILGEEIGEVNKAAFEAKFQGKDIAEYRTELIQSAAVIFSMIECFDRNVENRR